MRKPGKSPPALRGYGTMPGYQAAVELVDELLRVAHRIGDTRGVSRDRLRIEALSVLMATAEAGARVDNPKRERLYRHGWFGTYRCTGLIQDARDLGVLRVVGLSTDAVIRRAQQELTIATGVMTERIEKA